MAYTDKKKEVICFLGLKTTGKSYNSKILVEDFNFKKISLADPLRKMLYDIIGYIPKEKKDSISYSEFKTSNVIMEKAYKIFGIIPWYKDVVFCTGRHLLQNLGSIMREKVDKDFWVNLWVKDVLESTKHVVCDDMRYPNEIIKALSLSTKGCKVRFIWTQYKDADYENILKDTHESEALAIFMYKNRKKYNLYDGKHLSCTLLINICRDFCGIS